MRQICQKISAEGNAMLPTQEILSFLYKPVLTTRW